MNQKSKTNNFKHYVERIADYLDSEYGGFDNDGVMNDDEKHTVRNIMMGHYENGDSINNAANEVIAYLRKNRRWNKDHGIH